VTYAPASLLSNTTTERTEAGEQLLAPFVAPVPVRQRPAIRWRNRFNPANPKTSRRRALSPCSGPRSGTGGDEAARNQLSLLETQGERPWTCNISRSAI